METKKTPKAWVVISADWVRSSVAPIFEGVTANGNYLIAVSSYTIRRHFVELEYYLPKFERGWVRLFVPVLEVLAIVEPEDFHDFALQFGSSK